MHCGRQPGGEHVNDLGECPAATCEELHGTHGGTNAGRICWLVSGTMCSGEIQGTFARKYRDCQNCKVFLMVRQEERQTFMSDISRLLAYL
jgi:hypothetical protein